MRSSFVMKQAVCQVRLVESTHFGRSRARIIAMKTLLKRLLGFGMLAAAGYAMWRAYDRRKVDTGVTWDPQPFPYPPQPHTQLRLGAPPKDSPVAERRRRHAAGSSLTPAPVPPRTR